MKKVYTVAILFMCILLSQFNSIADDLYGWGSNNVGQLGDFWVISPKMVEFQFDKISTGNSFSIGIKQDGTLWAWGANEYGQLGDGTKTMKLKPIQIGNSDDWKVAVAGYMHAVAIKDDGSLWAWGANGSGQLGDGTTDSKNHPVQIGTSTDWVEVTLGKWHTIAIKSDGTLWGWGYNKSGQIGDGTNQDKNSPVKIGTDNDWKLVVAGYDHTLAIKKDGSLWAWGENMVNQLGDKTQTNQNNPVKIGEDNDWKFIAAGSQHSMAIKQDGTLWAWGLNGDGELGVGDDSVYTKNEPTQVGNSSDWKHVTAGFHHTIAMKTNSTLWGWGLNWSGQLGAGTIVELSPVQISNFNDWKNVSTGFDHTIAVKENGSLWVWGFNIYGQLGISSTINKDMPTKIGSIENWREISIGDNYSTSIKEDGSLWAWGDNFRGKLGTGSKINSIVPIPTQVGSSNDWKQISARYYHTIAIKTDGSLWAWGGNEYGTLGIGDNSVYAEISPIKVGSSNEWLQVAAGEYHNLALKKDGSLWAWGANSKYQLGDGTKKSKNIPTQIGTANNWKQVVVGFGHSVALKKDSTLWAWGRNDFGQIGDGTNTDRQIPTQIGTAHDWKYVVAGMYYTLAIKTDGSLWAWGDNIVGQLGDGTYSSKNIPTKIGDNDWMDISTSFNHILAIKTDGSLWAWGDNEFQQLGDGTTKSKNIPTQIGIDGTWTKVSAGRYHSMAIGSIKLIEKPQLLTPENNATNVKLGTLLTWSLIQGKKAVNVQMSKTPDFPVGSYEYKSSEQIMITSLNINEYATEYNTKYFWRVRVADDMDDNGNGDWKAWSDVFNFTTEQSVSVENQSKKSQFSLIGIYPNPVNSETTIEFENSYFSNVTITVSDLRGITVSKVVDAYFEAEIHRITFDFSNLKAGTYQICLNNGVQIISKSFVIIR